MQMNNLYGDPHTQLRALYVSLLSNQSHFDEFKQILSQYEVQEEDESVQESEEAAEVRARLNGRIGQWIDGPFHGLSARQAMLWRAIVVEERFNVALSPWKESNVY